MIIPYLLANGMDQELIRKKLNHGASGHDLITQERIHRFAEIILHDYNILKTPEIWQDSQYPNYYIMNRIDTSRPLWLSDSDSCAAFDINLIEDVRHELVRFWKDMWESGFAPCGFKLYVQPLLHRQPLLHGQPLLHRQPLLHGQPRPIIMMVGYSQCVIRNTLAHDSPIPNSDFFLNSCFPKGFHDYLEVILDDDASRNR